MRARNIKPGFFKNEFLLELPPLTRILFEGLWCMADREGRLEDRPKRIKIEVLPADDCDVDAALQSLNDCDLIQRYTVNGSKYIQVTHFVKHQNPHYKEGPSTIPAPCQPSANPGQTLGEPEANPRPAALIPDSLIPDSGFSDSVSLIPKSSSGGGNAREDWNPFGAGERPEITVEAYIANKLATPVNATMVDDLNDFEAQGLELEAVRYAVDLSLNAGSPRWDYARGIIQRWLRQGIKTLDGARAEQKRHDEEKAKTVQSVHSRASPRQDNRSARYLELAEEMERNGQG